MTCRESSGASSRDLRLTAAVELVGTAGDPGQPDPEIHVGVARASARPGPRRAADPPSGRGHPRRRGRFPAVQTRCDGPCYGSRSKRSSPRRPMPCPSGPSQRIGRGMSMSTASTPANRRIKTLTQPATRWEDGLPTGNGQVGAMVYGSIAHDVVVLNHEALWLRRLRPGLPDVLEHLPELRALLLAGEYEQAQFFLDERLS